MVSIPKPEPRWLILLVEDNEEVMSFLVGLLEREGYEVETANSVSEAERKLDMGEYHMVISDLRMEGEELAGQEVIKKAIDKGVRRHALITGHPELLSEVKVKTNLILKGPKIGSILNEIANLFYAPQGPGGGPNNPRPGNRPSGSPSGLPHPPKSWPR